MEEELLYIKSKLEVLYAKLKITNDFVERRFIFSQLKLLEERYQELKRELSKEKVK